MTGQRRAQQQDCDAGAGGLAEPHFEVEQRGEAEFAQQVAMSGLGGYVSGAAVIEHALIEARQWQHGGGRHKTVEQHRYPEFPRCEHRTGDPSQFAAAERCRYGQGITENAVMKFQASLGCVIQ